jgi:hypothetical protein
MEEFRLRLVGTWCMISSTIHPLGQPDDIQSLTSPEAKGFLIYSTDDFMACLIHEPDGSNVNSYSGAVSMEEEGGRIVVSHHVMASIPLGRIGTTQRRWPSISEESGEEILTITTDVPVQINGEEGMAVLKWKRASLVY